jgi:hypothetical protein
MKNKSLAVGNSGRSSNASYISGQTQYLQVDMKRVKQQRKLITVAMANFH